MPLVPLRPLRQNLPLLPLRQNPEAAPHPRNTAQHNDMHRPGTPMDELERDERKANMGDQ